MVDVDNFKLYNDHYGHPAGDDCLRRGAAEVGRTVRGTDLAARYGGEEFAVVMPHTDIAAAQQLAQRLLAAMDALAEPHLLSPKQIVTVSIGVAAMRPSGHVTQDELVELADIALYRAKRNGRDRVQASEHVRSPTVQREME
jgi:diguanylate cyclase (GGDEF)-like protein